MNINFFSKSLFSVAFFLNAVSNPLMGSIVETNTLKTIAAQADTNSLVLINITNTLYTSETAMGDSIWKDFFCARVNALFSDKNKADEIINHVKNKIVNTIPKRLVEPITAEVIAGLQAEKIPVIGFTMKSASTPYEGDFANLVNSYLTSLGIYLNATNNYFVVSSVDGENYDYANGILFTNKQPKDITLFSFLKHIQGAKPEKIFMVDTSQNNLKKMQASMEGKPYVFAGFKYKNESTRDKDFDQDIGIIQFIEFLNTGKIISDQEAFKLKNLETNYTAILDGLILGM